MAHQKRRDLPPDLHEDHEYKHYAKCVTANTSAIAIKPFRFRPSYNPSKFQRDPVASTQNYLLQFFFCFATCPQNYLLIQWPREHLRTSVMAVSLTSLFGNGDTRGTF